MSTREAVAAAARCAAYDAGMWALDELAWRAWQLGAWAHRKQARLREYGDRVGL